MSTWTLRFEGHMPYQDREHWPAELLAAAKAAGHEWNEQEWLHAQLLDEIRAYVQAWCDARPGAIVGYPDVF